MAEASKPNYTALLVGKKGIGEKVAPRSKIQY